MKLKHLLLVPVVIVVSIFKGVIGGVLLGIIHGLIITITLAVNNFCTYLGITTPDGYQKHLNRMDTYWGFDKSAD